MTRRHYNEQGPGVRALLASRPDNLHDYQGCANDVNMTRDAHQAHMSKDSSGAFANPKSLPRHIVSALVSANRCANCLGHLDTGWECNSCGMDWKPWMDASKATYDRAFDNREG